MRESNLASRKSLRPAADDDVSAKGLGKNSLGLLGAMVVGVSCVAPAYALSPSLAPIAQAVGAQLPAVMLLGFIPMLLVAFGYRELNRDMPDSGTTFTWATKAFGPWVGWVGGWGLLVSTIIVLSNTAGVAVNFFYFTVDRLLPGNNIEELGHNYWVNIFSCLMFMFTAAWISYRGVQATKSVLYALVVIQIVVLVWFSTAAWVHVINGTAPNTTERFNWSWFNPFEIGSFGAFASGLTIAVFLYWGWDTALAMNEETKNPEKTPGRAGVFSLLCVVVIYLVVTVSVVAFAGSGDSGVGLRSPEADFVDNIFKYLGEPVLGVTVSLMTLVVFTSSAASLQSTFLSPSHTLLTMGYYRALPKKFATVSKRFLSPSFAIFFSCIFSWLYYAALSYVSDTVLSSSVAALGVVVCFYYAITSFACVWYFKAELFTSLRNIVFKLFAPLLGGLFLLVIMVYSSVNNFSPENHAALKWGGVGAVFWISIGMIALGLIIMIIMRCVDSRFFRGTTLTRQTPVLDLEKEEVVRSM